MARSRSLMLLMALPLLLRAAAAGPVSVPHTAEMPRDGLFLTSTGAVQNPSPTVPAVWETFVDVVPVVAVHLLQIPGTDDVFYGSRVRTSYMHSEKDKTTDRIAGRLNLRDKSFTNVAADSNAFCSGQTFSDDGTILVIGGSPASAVYSAGGNKLRKFFADSNTFPDVGTMHDNRWYPTTVLMANKKVLIIGGTFDDRDDSAPSETYEIWDPAQPATMPQQFPVEPTHKEFAGQHWYPLLWLLPSGHVFTVINSRSRFFNQDGSYVMREDGKYFEAPTMPGGLGTGYPHTSSAALLGFNYDANAVRIVVMGGQKASYECPPNRAAAQGALASRSSYELTITWNYEAPGQMVYTFSDWSEEDMGLCRVGGDATLLPNGDVVTTSGLQTGCMGDPKRRQPRGDYAQHWTGLYQPDRAPGERWTVLAASPILRSYHSNAVLTRDGTILIAGCDVASPSLYTPSADFWSPSPTGGTEYRTEMLHTPYSLDEANKPIITAVDDNEDELATTAVAYGGSFLVAWAGPTPTDVTIVAPSANTHSFNTNQRVFYPYYTLDTDGQTVTVTLPDDPNVIVPQFYMVFLLNGKTHSTGRWLKLE